MPFDPNAADVDGRRGRHRHRWGAASCRWRRRAACASSPTTRSRAPPRRPRPTSPRCSTAWCRRGACRRTRPRRAVDRIAVARSLEEVAKANVIVEAIVERLDAKQALFARLDELRRPDTILASNTSSLPITAIAAEVQAPGARRRHALLQSGAADAPGRDHPRPQDRAVGDGRHDGARPAHDARAGAVHRQPGVPRQPRRPRLRAGVAAHPDRGHRHGRRDRPHPHRRAGLQDGAVRAGRPGRHRRAARRDGVGLRAVLQRAGVRALPALGAARGRRPLRPEDRRGLVHLRGRQEGRAAAALRRRRRGRSPCGCGRASITPTCRRR